MGRNNRQHCPKTAQNPPKELTLCRRFLIVFILREIAHYRLLFRVLHSCTGFPDKTGKWTILHVWSPCLLMLLLVPEGDKKKEDYIYEETILIYKRARHTVPPSCDPTPKHTTHLQWSRKKKLLHSNSDGCEDTRRSEVIYSITVFLQ